MKGLRTLVVALLLVAATGTVWAQWQPLAATPYATNSGSALTLGAGGTLYACFGGTNKFYRYIIATNTWEQRANLPTGTFGPGAALASNKTGYVYALAGGGTAKLWRYRASDNSWLQYADIPTAVNAGGALAYACQGGNAWVYALVGNNSNLFYRFGRVELPGQAETRDIRYWRELAPLPDTWQAYPGACLAWPVGVESIFCIPCDPNSDDEPSDSRRQVLSYSPSSNAWGLSVRFAAAGGKAGPGAAFTSFYYPASLAYFLACLLGDQSYATPLHDREARYRNAYYPGSDWTDLADTDPWNQGMGAAIASGDNLWYYAFFGLGQTAFARHYYYKVEGGTQSQERTGHKGYSLAVHPNPVGQYSVISFTLPASSNCRLTLCDAAGRVVGTLADQVLAAGCHSIAWHRLADASPGLPAGVYVLRLETGSSATTAKVIVR